MNRKSGGFIILIAAVGMLSGLIGNEISSLQSLAQITTTAFIGKTLIHISVVIGAYISGQMIPTAKTFGGE